MGSSDKGGPPLTRAEWFKIFNLVSAHKELPEVKEKLLPRNRITIIRAYNAACGLIEMGNTPLDEVKIQKIKKTGYGATERSIEHADSEYRAWLQHNTKSVVKDDINVAGSKYVEENDLHLKKLNALLSRIKNTIVNPHTETRFYPSHTTAWMFGGQDWRLTPKAWEMLVLPLLDDETIWNKPILFRYLLEHIKNSPFKQHYDELKKEISKFQEEFYDVEENIKINNPQMVADWDALDADLRNYVAVHKPMNDLMSLDRDDLENYIIGQKDMSIDLEADRVHISEIDPQYYEDLLIAFREYIVDLGNRYIVLEDVLQQLCDDLDDIEFKDVIKKGSCELCRTSVKIE
jgi:hypothetical protein